MASLPFFSAVTTGRAWGPPIAPGDFLGSLTIGFSLRSSGRPVTRASLVLLLPALVGQPTTLCASRLIGLALNNAKRSRLLLLEVRPFFAKIPPQRQSCHATTKSHWIRLILPNHGSGSPWNRDEEGITVHDGRPTPGTRHSGTDGENLTLVRRQLPLQTPPPGPRLYLCVAYCPARSLRRCRASKANVPDQSLSHSHSVIRAATMIVSNPRFGRGSVIDHRRQLALHLPSWRARECIRGVGRRLSGGSR